MAVVFGLVLLFLTIMGTFRLMYLPTINIFNDLVLFYGSEFWAYFMIGAFLTLVFSVIIVAFSFAIRFYVDYRMRRF